MLRRLIAVRDPDGDRHDGGKLTVAAAWLIAVFTAAVILGGAIWLVSTINGLQSDARARQERLDELTDQYVELYEQAEQEGVTPRTVQPDEVRESAQQTVAGPQGERGERGPRGFTGPPGEPGRDGRDGTPGQEGPQGLLGAAGIDGRDGFNGERGAPGPAGIDGAPGPAGPAGPAGPKGDPGPAGPAGKDGQNGRGIQTVQCQDSGSWLFTYTDGSTQTVSGPCRLIPGPPTTPANG